ncbi:MAG: M23 family metallopeptidase [Motilibacteraceae bacterium]
MPRTRGRHRRSSPRSSAPRPSSTRPSLGSSTGRLPRSAADARAAAPHAALVLAAACLITAAVGGLEASSAGAQNVQRTTVNAAAPASADLREVAPDTQRDPAAEQRAIAAAKASEARRLKVEAQRQAAAKALAERKAAAARAAREAARPRLVLPVASYTLTARFHQRSGLWSSGSHTGLDFAAPTGTPVRAVADGVVVSAGWDGAYGNKIVVRHADGTTTWYCHLSAYVVRGGAVKAGEVIGRVGSTGNTTGPHLHLEVHPGGGGPVDPYSWLVAHGLRP